MPAAWVPELAALVVLSTSTAARLPRRPESLLSQCVRWIWLLAVEAGAELVDLIVDLNLEDSRLAVRLRPESGISSLRTWSPTVFSTSIPRGDSSPVRSPPVRSGGDLLELIESSTGAVERVGEVRQRLRR